MTAYAVGTAVRAVRVDPPHHSRVPRYVRGAHGTVVEVEGAWPLADAVAQGRRPAPEPVYAVRFDGAELFGDGAHDVVVDLWHSHLEPVEASS